MFASALWVREVLFFPDLPTQLSRVEGRYTSNIPTSWATWVTKTELWTVVRAKQREPESLNIGQTAELHTYVYQALPGPPVFEVCAQYS